MHGEEYGGSYLSNKLIYNPNFNGIVQVGDYQSVFALKIDYNNVYTNIGEITQYYEGADFYDLRLIDQNSTVVAYLRYNKNGYITGKSNMDITDYTIPKQYIRTSTLYYDQIYTLVVYARDTNEYTITTNIKDSWQNTFIFLRQNAVISGGYIQNNGSGESFTQQQSTNTIINNNNDNTQAIISALTNSTISSGDEPTFEDLPVVDFNFNIGDESGDFFTWVLTEFVNVLNSNENITIDIPIYDTHNYVPSNFWILDIEPLRTFISARLVVYCWCSFFKVYS